MLTRDALAARYLQAGLLAPGQGVDAMLRDRWVRMRIFGRLVPVKPMLGQQQALLLHDTHHLLTGYGTSFRGELELAAWELASGGCGRYVLFWINRVNALLMGLVLCPRRTLAALRKGAHARNLYWLSIHDVLERDVDDVRAYAEQGRRAPAVVA